MAEKHTSFEETYPHIARWIKSSGWIEIGRDEYSTSLVRALDEGGLVWESTADSQSLDQALRALEVELAEWIAQNE